MLQDLSRDSKLIPDAAKITLTGRNDESEIHETAEDEFVVFEAVEDVFEGDATLAGGATLILFEPGFDIGAFVLLEPEQMMSITRIP